jgi:hypothetical protein
MKRKLLTFFTSALVPNFSAPFEHHAHVGVAAQRTLFHVAVGDAGVEQNLLQPREVLEGLVGRADVGLAHDLHQRRAAAVQVEIRARAESAKPSCRLLPASSSMCSRVMPMRFDPPSSVGTSIHPCSAIGLSNCEIW